MADSDDEKNGFTFLWKIENCRLHALPEYGYFQSPIFIIEMLNHTQRRLKLYPCDKLHDCLGINIEKVDGSTKNSVEILFHLLTENGPYFLDKIAKRKFDVGDSVYKYLKKLKCSDVFKDSSKFIENDTLTLKCHLWNGATVSRPSMICTAVSHIQAEKRMLIWTLENMEHSLGQPMKKTIFSPTIDMPNIEITLIPFGLVMKVILQIFNADEQKLYKMKIEATVFNNGKMKMDSLKKDWLIQPEEDTLTFFLKTVFNKSSKELTKEGMEITNCVSSLQIELSISNGNVWSRVQECISAPDVFHDSRCKQGSDKLCHQETMPHSLKMPETAGSGISSLVEDLSQLLNEKKFCDITLKSVGKEFMVHKTILVARSSVFATMFESDMKEKETGAVTIDDIDPETLEQFLNYLYTGKADNLTSENVVSLYSAADKYEIKALKDECSFYILKHLSTENVCDILILSDMYLDEVLKKAAKETFCLHYKDILLSKEWVILLQKRPELAVEVLREMAQRIK